MMSLFFVSQTINPPPSSPALHSWGVQVKSYALLLEDAGIKNYE